MADQVPQNFENHARWVPPFHFVLMPVLLLHLFWRLYRLIFVFDKSQGRAEPVIGVIMAVAYLGIALAARIFALQAQDRVIRLEEHLRWQKLLPPADFARAGDVGRRQLIALRFAPDAELPGLFSKVLGGELQDPKAIKQAIKNWRPDYHRV